MTQNVQVSISVALFLIGGNMELKDRVVIIEEKNMSRLLNLYGEIKDADELSKIINRHLEVVIDEIEEDNRRQRNVMAMAKIDRDCPCRKETDFDEY